MKNAILRKSLGLVCLTLIFILGIPQEMSGQNNPNHGIIETNMTACNGENVPIIAEGIDIFRFNVRNAFHINGKLNMRGHGIGETTGDMYSFKLISNFVLHGTNGVLRQLIRDRVIVTNETTGEQFSGKVLISLLLNNGKEGAVIDEFQIIENCN